MRPKKTPAAKKAVHTINNGMISKILMARVEYNSSGRSVASVTIQTVDGVQHTFSAPLSPDLQDRVRDMAGEAMRGLPLQFE